MNGQTQKGENKFVKLLKSYGYYILLGFLIIVMAIILVVASLTSGTKPKEDISIPTSSNAITIPVLNASILKEYSDTELQFNTSLNRWEVHKAIDFSAESGANVLACSAGRVSEIYSNQLEGTVIVIEHDNNIKSIYGSLAENVNVEVGDIVNSGDVIGTASNSGIGETDQSHVHFEVWKDGTAIDPAGYLNIDSK